MNPQPVNSERETPQPVHLCRGCDAPTTWGDYCPRCDEEISAICPRYRNTGIACSDVNFYDTLPRIDTGIISRRDRVASGFVAFLAVVAFAEAVCILAAVL